METKDSVRYWAGVVGAVAVVAGILAVVVMVRMPSPKKTAQQTQPTKGAPQPQTGGRASQQLMKHDKISRQQAVDRILAARKSGQGWASLSRGFGLKVADLLSDVKKTDKQVAKLVLVKASR